jgi:nucleoid-associated protein YgaU
MAIAGLRTLAATLAGLTLSGCGFVHFGSLPPSDPRVAQENTDLRLERSILQQELAIVRKEGDRLRTALDARAAGGREGELAAQLETTTRELAALRVRYASLRDEQSRTSGGPVDAESAAAAAALQSRLTATEDHLAAALRDYTQLRDENVRLRQDIERARGVNATLAAQVRDLGTQNKETQTALTQLNAELLAQKESRARAEQDAEALRAQLHTVVTQSQAPGPAPTLNGSRETTASSASAIEIAGLLTPRVPVGNASPTATLSTNPERARAVATPGPAGKTAAESVAVDAKSFAAAAPRIHQVAAGDTLEKVAAKYYGDPERWPLIYDANRALLHSSRTLTPGMELTIPDGPAPTP